MLKKNKKWGLNYNLFSIKHEIQNEFCKKFASSAMKVTKWSISFIWTILYELLNFLIRITGIANIIDDQEPKTFL